MRDVDKLRVGGLGLFVVGLPASSQIIVEAIMKKSGAGPADVVGSAISLLASKLLTPEDQKVIAEKIKDFNE